jgi:HSP20 family molecular chaperone IbpA/uncharacterized protein YndB with AHSA1/START domain
MARIEKSIEVNAPLRTVYNQWTQFEEFPRFMEGVEEVKQLDDTHLRWRANVAGKEKQWQGEITEQLPDRRIAWRSIGGARNEGAVEFTPLGEERTLVRLTMEYDPEGFFENVGDALGVMSRRVAGDLERFRDYIEWRGRETGQWRGEVHHGQERRQGAERASGMQGGRDTRRFPGAQAPSRFGAWPFSADAWQDPFSRLRRMSQEMDVLFERLMGSGPRRFGSEHEAPMHDLWTPHVDIEQQGNELVVCADLPGTRKEDVHVDIEDGRLVIQGERRSSHETTEGGIRRSERTYGQFYREIPLPQGADMEGARASLQDGVLEVRVQVPGRRQGRRLEINTGRAEQQAMASQAPGMGSGAGSSGSLGAEPERPAASEGGVPPQGGQGTWHLGR